ncbi:hypothetical protein ACGFY9_06865 [Streptomyces sp. NPDC048504]|uniref:hypothetical protein n=1 Tax=Streptomyces sp. NPDC048504 TaxID=3365559 RepID=UPI0037173BBA
MVLVMAFGAAPLSPSFLFLFLVGGLLVTDGTQVFLPEPRAAWKDPARAPGLDVPSPLSRPGARVPQAKESFARIAVHIAFPVVAHAATDVLAARVLACVAVHGDSRPDGADVWHAAPHHITGSTAEPVSEPRGGS